jgi:acyl-CoA synthetase (NDP forming)
MEQGLENMDYIFHPRSIAFVGATETVMKWGFIVFFNLKLGGYEGELYPVNPGRDKVQGHKAYPSVKDIPGEVDLAIFTIPAKSMPGAIDDCVLKGVKAGLIISAGFKEKGGEFREMEAELAQKARAGNMVLVGPNCNGVSCVEEKLSARFVPVPHPLGRVGVVSQSGVITDMLAGVAVEAGFGVSKTVSSGNEAYLKSEDYYTYFSEDPTIDVIVSYIEGISDGRRFMDKARAAAAKKPIIVVKGGRTEYGMSAAGSHTGALAVKDELFDSMCRQTGLIRARNPLEAGTLAVSFLNRPLPRGRRVGIITGAGGIGVLASDACHDEGLELVRLTDETLRRIDKHMPDWWVPGNPVDFVAGLDFQNIKPVTEILMRSGEVDAIIMLMGGPPRARASAGQAKDKKMPAIFGAMKNFTKTLQPMYASIFELSRELNVPIYGSGGPIQEDEQFNPEKDFSRYSSVEIACRAVRVMADYYQRK